MPDADEPMVTMPIPDPPPPPPPPPAPMDGHLCGDTYEEEAESGRAFLARKREETLDDLRHRIAHHAPPNDDVVAAHEDVRGWTFAYARAMVDVVPASPELDCAVDTLIDTVMHLCNAAVARRPRAVKPRDQRLGPLDHLVLSDHTLGLSEPTPDPSGLGIPLTDGGALTLAGFLEHGAHRCVDGGQRAGGSDTCDVCVAALNNDTEPESGPYVVQWDGTGLAVEAINASVAALGGYIEAQVDDRPGTPEDFLNVFTPGLTSQGGERRLAMRKGWWLAVNENRWAVATTMAEAVAAVATPADG